MPKLAYFMKLDSFHSRLKDVLNRFQLSNNAVSLLILIFSQHCGLLLTFIRIPKHPKNG